MSALRGRVSNAEIRRPNRLVEGGVVLGQIACELTVQLLGAVPETIADWRGADVAVSLAGARRESTASLEEERDRLRREVATIAASLDKSRVAFRIARDRLARYEGGDGFDAWELGRACGEWFSGLAARGARFSLLEVD